VIGRDGPLSVSHREVRHRHGSHLLEQIDEVLAAADLTIVDIEALVVGTGPGSFTGLRVGMATAKTLAYARSLPLVGVMSSTALRHAAAAAGAAADMAMVLPAGARDHYLVRAGEDPVLVAPGGLAAALGEAPVMSLDMDPEPLGVEAADWGKAALEGLPSALLALAHDRLAHGTSDDIAGLVPAYVALPRGVAHAADELGWSPDLR
jgi:tRNA threonylcarbamoyl adenosine modification protein YeaZ